MYNYLNLSYVREIMNCFCFTNFPVPPLEGFVMNRVLGDYFETLLYKIFVSIDEHTTVAEVRIIMTFYCCVSHDILLLYFYEIYRSFFFFF